MSSIIEILIHQHDLRFVVLAATICALAAFAGLALLVHARRTPGPMRAAWVAVAAVSVGFGIWATHFVAMLSFDVGFPVGYDINTTLVSLAIAIGACGAGFGFAAIGARRSDLLAGGAAVGMGISLMHYIGMQAMQMGGAITWQSGTVALSVILGIVLGALALRLGAAPRSVKSRWIGTGLLTLAICSMHFTSMGAAGFENCYPITGGGVGAVSPQILALAVGVVSIIVLLFALGGLFLDLRDRKRAAVEASRMRGLADAAVEGLLICEGRTIVTVNSSFVRLAGTPASSFVGRDVGSIIASAACLALFEKSGEVVESEIQAGDGSTIPVEVVRRDVDFGGRMHQVLAVRDLRARRAAEHHIRFLAHHDAMTGLANRARFLARLEEEIVQADLYGQRFAVLCLDLDRFKEVNDLFGHAAGDSLLQRVASAISEGLDKNQFAARLGGDEFALILPDIGSRERAGEAASSILDAFSSINETSTHGTLISTSIGVAIFPDDTRDGASLMTYADTALYCAKGEGRNTYCVFEAEMGAQIRDRRQLEYDLRQAVARDELSLVYQPQVDIASGEVTGFEALLRWHHPERGQVPPSDFIPIAEDSGLILQIGDWVLRQACREAARWVSPLTIAVNVSAVQLHAPHFVQGLKEALISTGLDPARLEIEITETALIRNINSALTSLKRIKALGVRVAMDDFGTGYSSLSNLRAFPFDKIKVDQSFIRAVHTNAQSAAIVRAVLGLGKGLNLPILAEGVEQSEELEFLRGEICDSAQGYWFGKPQEIGVYSDIVAGRVRSLTALEAPERKTA